MMMNDQSIEAHTLSVLVENSAGVLARVIGLFSGRGYNIESLTVAEVDGEAHMSRITIVTSGSPMVIEQIKAQLSRIVPVSRVTDLTVEAEAIEREMALVKVAGTGEKRVEALRVGNNGCLHNVTDQPTDQPTASELLVGCPQQKETSCWLF